MRKHKEGPRSQVTGVRLKESERLALEQFQHGEGQPTVSDALRLILQRAGIIGIPEKAKLAQ